jgi:hypothetical protein
MWKKTALIVILVFVILIVGLKLHSQTRSPLNVIVIEKLDNKPNYFLEISGKDLKGLPEFRNAIEGLSKTGEDQISYRITASERTKYVDYFESLSREKNMSRGWTGVFRFGGEFYSMGMATE